jgi:Putative beta-barrel porin-2, OmpL-like. bbp2
MQALVPARIPRRGRWARNGAVGGISGFGLNLMDGNLTVLALTHFGPEQTTRLLSPLGVNANGQWRYFNDVIVTRKASNIFTLVTEANLIRDGFGAAGKPVNGFGIAQYASCALTGTIALNGRVEYWRDDNNFFVASFPSNSGPVMAQQGFAVPFLHTAPGTNTTYGALTLGVTWKPRCRRRSPDC